jgi:phage gp36-like protein
MYADQEALFKAHRQNVLLYAVDDEEVGEWTDRAYGRIDDALQRATDEIDSYLGQRFSLPIRPTPRFLRSLAVDIASYHVLSRRGFDPESADQIVVERYANAVKWLEKASKGQVSIPADDGTLIPPSPTTEGGTIRSDATPEIESAGKLFGRGKLKGW